LDNISKATYHLKVQDFLMYAKMVGVEMVDNTAIIMTQDPLHVGEKL
jgi:hypothetical protein